MNQQNQRREDDTDSTGQIQPEMKCEPHRLNTENPLSIPPDRGSDLNILPELGLMGGGRVGAPRPASGTPPPPPPDSGPEPEGLPEPQVTAGEPIATPPAPPSKPLPPPPPPNGAGRAPERPRVVSPQLQRSPLNAKKNQPTIPDISMVRQQPETLERLLVVGAIKSINFFRLIRNTICPWLPKFQCHRPDFDNRHYNQVWPIIESWWAKFDNQQITEDSSFPLAHLENYLVDRSRAGLIPPDEAVAVKELLQPELENLEFTPELYQGLISCDAFQDWLKERAAAFEVKQMAHMLTARQLTPELMQEAMDRINATIATTPTARPLSSLVSRLEADPDELLATRYLCRSAGLLLCGPTGIGKSSLSMQAMILWAIGREAFGIRPARPLKSLVVQAENDDGDLTEMRDGVVQGLKLTEEEVKQAVANVFVIREDQRTNAAFFAQTVKPLLRQIRPDLLWIDPALSYLGGETSSQKDVGGFLRNQLNPLLHEFGCGCVIVHHTNKPASGKEKPAWQAGDFAYLGSGSAEWANWARATLTLRSIGSHEIFELHAAKRGGRLGWQAPDGTKSYVRYIAHAKEPGVIYWRDAEAEELDLGGRPGQTGQPGQTEQAEARAREELLKILPPEGLTTTEWLKLAETRHHTAERTFYRDKDRLEEAGLITKNPGSKKWKTTQTV